MNRAALLALLVSAQGCAVQNGVTGTVDPGDNFVAPDLTLDENFFFCRIEPDVIQKYGCATRNSCESGHCHDSRSALRLTATNEPAPCDSSGRLTGRIPDAYVSNLDAVRFFVQADPLTSPLYLRPLNQA